MNISEYLTTLKPEKLLLAKAQKGLLAALKRGMYRRLLAERKMLFPSKWASEVEMMGDIPFHYREKVHPRMMQHRVTWWHDRETAQIVMWPPDTFEKEQEEEQEEEEEQQPEQPPPPQE